MWPIVTGIEYGLSVCHDHEPCKNGQTSRDAIWVVDSDGLTEPCIRWSNVKGQSGEGKGAAHCTVLGLSALSCAKTAESIIDSICNDDWSEPKEAYISERPDPRVQGQFLG